MKVPNAGREVYKRSLPTLALLSGLSACGGETTQTAQTMPAVLWWSPRSS